MTLAVAGDDDPGAVSVVTVVAEARHAVAALAELALVADGVVVRCAAAADRLTFDGAVNTLPIADRLTHMRRVSASIPHRNAVSPRQLAHLRLME